MAITCWLGQCEKRQYPGRDLADLYDHERLVHTGVTNEIRTAHQWETAADHLIHAAARLGQPFLIADVLKPIGEHPTPGKRQSINGAITTRVAADGWIRHATDHDSAKSTKPSSNSSLVRRWIGTEKATGKAVAA